MFKFVLGITVGTTFILQACTQSQPVTASPVQKNEQNQHYTNQKNINPETKEGVMADMNTREYWVKTYGSPIFNDEGTVTGSLRLIAKVSVFEIKNGMARISKSSDQWVAFDILSKTKPEGRITGPDNDNDLPRIKLPTNE